MDETDITTEDLFRKSLEIGQFHLCRKKSVIEQTGLLGKHVVRKGSWKERKVRKLEMKLERKKFKNLSPTWKLRLKVENPIEVGQFSIKLERTSTWKTTNEVFNFRRDFSTSRDTFQLNMKVSKFRLSNLEPAKFSFFPTPSFQLVVS